MKNYLILISLSLFSLVAAGQPSWIDDGLVAYYPFDGNSNNYSNTGSGNNGNGADLNYTADRFETPRAALENIEQKRFETSTEMIFDPEELTYSAWIKKKKIIEAGGAVVALGNITTNRRSNLFISSEVAEINRKSGVGYVGQGNDGFGGFEDSMDWSMVTVSKYGKLVSTYVNGKFTGQFELGLTQEQISSRIFIGWNGDEGHYNGETFLGRLDDVRIYNRALSATEVTELYDYESKPQPIEEWINDGLEAHITFDQGSLDLTGNGNDGIIDNEIEGLDRIGSADAALFTDGKPGRTKLKSITVPYGDDVRTFLF